MKYCALCCTVKDEDPFLKEWLAYHALIGFEHFIVYDDRSAVPVAELLGDWVSPEQVTIIRTPGGQPQSATYSHCLETFGDKYFWLAFLDLDEFIRLEPEGAGEEQGNDIRFFLAEFEPYAALGLNWRMFSSAGHERTPPGPVIGNYARCLGDDAHIKSIVQPAKTKGYAGPHSFFPKESRHAVNPEHFPIPSGFPFSVAATRRAAVNHYFYKSRECFRAKIERGNPCNIAHRMDEFERQLQLPDTRDNRLLPYADRVAATCAAKRLVSAEALKNAPGKAPATDFRTHMDCARAFAERGKLRQTLLHLCYAGMEMELSGAADPVFSLEMWALRAEAANRMRHYERAEQYLKRAFTYEAAYKTYAELATLFAHTGRVAESKQALAVLKMFSAMQGGADAP